MKNNKSNKDKLVKWKLNAVIVAIAATGGASFSALAASEEADDQESQVIQIVGSRSQKTRTIADSTVPVDIISDEILSSLGSTADLTDNLKAVIPSYTATPATGDGSAFVRPTSLRGTASDQTLVLVNGKRRHRSALVQFFAPAAGNGAHGVDIGMIPSIAVQRVEVLRDGAASQYGSDAIAGVINFVMKDAAEGGQFQVEYGQFYEGEESIKFAFNKGIALGDNGFANFSLESNDNDALSRGIQRPDAQALIDSGVVGVGQDSPFDDAPFAQSWGRPETEGVRFFLNSGVNLDNGNKFYARLGYADTSGRYRFFYRNPNHSSLTAIREIDDTILPAGFTPFLDGDQTDLSFSTGLEGDLANGTFFDISIGYGENELDYFLNNTVNPSLGLVNGQIPQMDFNVGGYKQEEVTLNADFSIPVGEQFNVAYGFEWREETYSAIAGEAASYEGAGSSGFKGITPQDAGSFDRDNFAIYADIEQDVNSDVLLQYALRYEDFSDFGSTVNGKFAGRFVVSDTTSLRGAISTGFHAPTPGQANVRTTITTFDGNTGLQVEEGLVPSTDPRVAAVGGKELSEEKSFNISLGVTSDIGESTTLTLDFYKIEVDDRIYRTGDIAVPDTTNTISFYTNALDVEHSGFDLVLSSDVDWSEDISTDVAFAFSYSEIDVVNQRLVNGVQPVNDGLVEDIENNYPTERFVLTTNTFLSDNLNLMLRANFYGEHYDERGRINGVDGGLPSAEIGSTIYIDAEIGYQFNDDLKITLGFTNLFDEFVDEIGLGNANRQSVGLQYPRRSAANYEGGSWYLGGTYTF